MGWGHPCDESGGFNLGHGHAARATQQIVGLGRERTFQIRSGRWSEGREGGSHQSLTSKELDRWGKPAGLALRVVCPLPALPLLPSRTLRKQP